MIECTQPEEFVNKLRDAFDAMAVYKDLKKNNFISAFKLPSFMRDWVIGRFQDDDGQDFGQGRCSVPASARSVLTQPTLLPRTKPR